MADLLNKDFKTPVSKMLKELKKYVGNVKKMMYEQMKYQQRDRSPKRNPKEILEMKSRLTEMNNPLQGYNGRCEKQKKERKI